MANTITLRNRIKSVRSTRQITKAMELVAASKMRRAQEAAAASRAYRRLAQSILHRLRQTMQVDQHPLFVQRPVTSKLYVVVSGDRGLSGAYNSNVFRRITQLLLTDAQASIQSQCIVIGKRGAQFLSRLEGVSVLAAYEHFPERPTANDLRPLLDTLIDNYTNKTVDAVDVIYTDFKSSVNQEVTVLRLLPAAYAPEPVEPDIDAVAFEPSPEAVLAVAAERLTEVQLWQAVLESKASEFSMSMMAMKSASDNASDIIDDLTLAYNTARQASITQELAEITGGAEAIK